MLKLLGESEYMTRYAFLIGCEEYSNFTDISFCQSDVGLIQETLVNYCDYEYETIEIIFQYKGCDDTPKVIYKKLQTMIDKAEDGDSILFYFAGHGVKEGEKGYLLLADSKASDFQNTALDLAKINELLRNPRINGFLILDACHSGILARNAFNSSVADIISDTGCVTLASCSENEESYPYPEKEQGVFTYYFCEEIKKISVGAPVYIEGLKMGVCNSVTEWAKNNYKHQTPTLNGQIVGNKAIAFRNFNNYERGVEVDIEEDFKMKLEHLEEEFFNRCYCANLEFGSYDVNDILENYTLAKEICLKLESSKYKLVDGWEDALLKLQFYSSRIKEKKEIGISLLEKKEVLEQIYLFVEAIPIKYEHDITKIDEKENNGLSAKQKIQDNISKFVMDFASKLDEVMDETTDGVYEKATNKMVGDESEPLYAFV